MAGQQTCVTVGRCAAGMAAHLLTAGILTPKAGRERPELLLQSCSPKPSAERTGRAGAAWDVDRFTKHAVSNVERLTAVHMDARTCSRVRAHGRGRRCGVGSQAHGAPSDSLE
jgi:hypothetical protein